MVPNNMVAQCFTLTVAVTLAVAMSGCVGSEAEAKRGPVQLPSGINVEMDDENVVPGPRFVYAAESNAEFGPIAESMVFTDSSGRDVKLSDLSPDKPVALIVTRGPIAADPAGAICPVCSTQVARLIRKYEDFQAAGAEVVVVYPQAGVSRDAFSVFIDDVHARLESSEAIPPFPIVFDYDHAAVKELGLVGDSVKPSTFLFDANHRLKFAFVGDNPLHRPSTQSLIDQIKSWSSEDGIEGSGVDRET